MKKIFLIFIALFMAVSTFLISACSNTPKGVKGTLSIASFEGGYGKTWASKLAEAYKVHNPQAEVVVRTDPLVRDDAVTALQTGISSVDLFFIDGASIGTYLETYDTIADISELYNLAPKAGQKEEDVLIKDKIFSEVVEEMKYGGDREEFVGKYYTVPTPSGPCSLILNRDALNLALGEGNWEVPRTTNEMIALSDRIIAANAKVNVAGINYTIYPFIYSGNAVEYWRYMYYPWIAQYDGVEAFSNMQSYKINGEYNQAAFNPPSKLLAFSIMEKILKRANNYCDPTSMGNSFSASQKFFFQNRACMYVTGDWLEREMEAATEYRADLIMVKPPVISDLIQKIEQQFSINLGNTQQEKDAKLSTIIKDIDDGKTSSESISQDVFNAIKQARSITYSLANNAIGIVPKSSINQDMAIDFLRFMYSEEGIEIVMRETKANLPVHTSVKIDDIEYSPFRQSVNEIALGNVKYIFSSTRDPIRYRAGLDEYVRNEKPEIALAKKTGAMTALELVNNEVEVLARNWEDYMRLVAA